MIFTVTCTSGYLERYETTLKRYGAKPSEKQRNAQEVYIGNMDALMSFISELYKEAPPVNTNGSIVITDNGGLEIYDDYRE